MAALDEGAEELLEREPALREIDALVAEARARGERPIVRVAGPPGIGKTAVLAMFARRFRGRACFAAAQPGRRASAGAVALALVGSSHDAAADRGGLVRRLRALAAEHEIVVIDDIQWLDELTLRVLSVVMRNEASSAVFLFADRREDAPELPPHRTVILSPLSRTAAIELVRQRYRDAPASLAADIAEAAAGLPFGLTFLADDAAKRAVQRPDDSARSIGAVIGRRLSRASALARDAARLIALVDPPVLLEVVAGALSTTVGRVAAALVEIGDLVILDGAHVAFRHAAIADAVAETVPNVVSAYSRLLRAHGTDDDDTARLATIVRCAIGCANGDRAAQAALHLARELARAGSLGSALRYAEIALEQVRRPPPVEYAVEYAGILHQLARYQKAAEFLRHAVRSAIDAGESSVAAELLASFCGAAISLERFGELEKWCERVEALPTCMPSVVTRILSVRLAALAYAGRFDEYFDLAAHADLAWVDLRTLGFIRALSGEAASAARAVDAYRAGLHMVHARQQPVDRLLESTITFLDSGVRSLDELDELDDISDGEARHPSELALRILARICDGRWDEARRLLRETQIADDEPDQLLEVRLLLAALGGDVILDARPLRTLRAMIARRRIRHAVGPARWFVLTTDAEVAADIEVFVRETLLISPMPYALGALPVAVARLSDRFGRDSCNLALERFPAYGSAWHRAHRDLALGTINRDNARLRTARDAFDAMNVSAFAAIAGIQLPVPRARDIALAHRIGILAAEARRPAELTPRERDIAELTASGASNRQIATALKISERTVETHLTKVFAKLGVASRSGLAARLLTGDR